MDGLSCMHLSIFTSDATNWDHLSKTGTKEKQIIRTHTSIHIHTHKQGESSLDLVITT